MILRTVRGFGAPLSARKELSCFQVQLAKGDAPIQEDGPSGRDIRSPVADQHCAEERPDRFQLLEIEHTLVLRRGQKTPAHCTVMGVETVDISVATAEHHSAPGIGRRTVDLAPGRERPQPGAVFHADGKHGVGRLVCGIDPACSRNRRGEVFASPDLPEQRRRPGEFARHIGGPFGVAAEQGPVVRGCTRLGHLRLIRRSPVQSFNRPGGIQGVALCGSQGVHAGELAFRVAGAGMGGEIGQTVGRHDAVGASSAHPVVQFPVLGRRIDIFGAGATGQDKPVGRLLRVAALMKPVGRVVRDKCGQDLTAVQINPRERPLLTAVLGRAEPDHALDHEDIFWRLKSGGRMIRLPQPFPRVRAKGHQAIRWRFPAASFHL